jgi:hypothetical protein
MVFILGVDKLGHAAICVIPCLIQNFHVFISSKDKLVDVTRKWTETSGLVIDIALGKSGVLEKWIKLIVRNVERSEPTIEQKVSMNSRRSISMAQLRKFGDFVGATSSSGELNVLSVSCQ